MGIGRTFAAALMKAVRGLDLKFETLTGGTFAEWSDDELVRALEEPTHDRLFADRASCCAAAARVDELHALSTIDRFWLWEFDALVALEEACCAVTTGPRGDAPALNGCARARRLLAARDHVAFGRRGRTALGDRGRVPHGRHRGRRVSGDVAVLLSLARRAATRCGRPAARRWSSSAAGRSASAKGSSSITSCVHAAWALREAGRAAVVINNNPETVSTDFDVSRRAGVRTAGRRRSRGDRARDRRARRHARLRRTDRDQSRRRARRSAASRSSAATGARSTWPRTARSSTRRSRSSASRARAAARRTRSAKRARSRASSVSRCWCGRRTCWAAAAWRSSTTRASSRRTWRARRRSRPARRCWSTSTCAAARSRSTRRSTATTS